MLVSWLQFWIAFFTVSSLSQVVDNIRIFERIEGLLKDFINKNHKFQDFFMNYDFDAGDTIAQKLLSGVGELRVIYLNKITRVSIVGMLYLMLLFSSLVFSALTEGTQIEDFLEVCLPNLDVFVSNLFFTISFATFFMLPFFGRLKVGGVGVAVYYLFFCFLIGLLGIVSKWGIFLFLCLLGGGILFINPQGVLFEKRRNTDMYFLILVLFIGLLGLILEDYLVVSMLVKLGVFISPLIVLLCFVFYLWDLRRIFNRVNSIVEEAKPVLELLLFHQTSVFTDEESDARGLASSIASLQFKNMKESGRKEFNDFHRCLIIWQKSVEEDIGDKPKTMNDVVRGIAFVIQGYFKSWG